MMGEVIRVSGRAADVGDFLKEAMLSQRFADVALCCPGGQRFLAHRLVLSAASPYLQEVLLAHSKAAAYCEPITVILAEVEAPELAALLGFVYTGSATVPRVRLEAFLRAAEALRIRLPPVPVVMTCGGGGERTDCKLEDVKVSPKYLRCEQYPASDGWYRPATYAIDGSINGRKEACVARIFSSDDNRDGNREIAGVPRCGIDNSPIGPHAYGPACPPAGAWAIDSFSHRDGATGDRAIAVGDQDRVVTTMGARCHELANGVESSLSVVYQTRGACPPAGAVAPPSYAEGHGGTPLERIGRRPPGDYEGMRTTGCGGPSSVKDDGGPMDEAAGDFCGRQTRGDDCARDCPYEGGMQSLPLECAPPGRARPYERTDYAHAGEDLSCGESCCRWRTARRHVANRVTASPWRQIVRPHHSPRMRPVIAQRPVDDVEIQRGPSTPEPPRSTVISMSPKIQSPRSAPPRNDGPYNAFETTTVSCETSFAGESRSRDATGGPEARIQEIYRPALPFAATNQIAAPLDRASTTLIGNETPAYQNTGGATPPARLLSTGASGSNDSVITSAGKNHGGYPAQVVSQTTTSIKPELSHPISRLCDTIETDDKKKETPRTETAEKSGDERVARIFVNSDNNNNNETIVGAEVVVVQRGRSSADDHRCDQCGKTFVTRASLKVHSRTHSGEKPFRCADCGKQFSQLRNYKYHRSVHEGTREFAATCPECGKYFNDRGYLSSHMKIHRNRKEYGCAECGKSFNQRVAYNMHVRIHTGVKPHQCEQCGKAFSRKMLLKQHLRTHSGERPYQCQVCQKAFADRSNMTLHTRLHSGLKPYQCTLCSKAFTKKHHLKTHLNYHTGTKPYSCPNCGLRFSQSSNMRTHYKKCSVNNPAGGGLAKTARDAEAVGSERTADAEGGGATPSSQTTRSPTDAALTPPNSDQESSILTPITKSAAVVAVDVNT